MPPTYKKNAIIGKSDSPLIYPSGISRPLQARTRLQGKLYLCRDNYRNFNRKSIKIFHAINVTKKDSIAGNLLEKETSPEMWTAHFKRIQNKQQNFYLNSAINMTKNGRRKAHLIPTLLNPELMEELDF